MTDIDLAKQDIDKRLFAAHTLLNGILLNQSALTKPVVHLSATQKQVLSDIEEMLNTLRNSIWNDMKGIK